MTSPPVPFLRPNLVPHRTYAHYLDDIDSSHLYSNNGPLACRFEADVVDRLFSGCGAAAAVSSATLGLLLAIARLRRPRGRYAVMPSFTFVATPLAARWAGLEPYFVDVDPASWSVSAGEWDAALALLGDDVGVVVPCAPFGSAIDLEHLGALHRAGTPVVIDAAASLGTTTPAGHFGVGFPGAVVYSLHATKAFGIGEGGLVYSADPVLVGGVRRAANFGFDAHRKSVELGLNAKLSEYAAAVGLATLEAFPEKVAERARIGAAYLAALDEVGALAHGWRTQSTNGSVPYQFMSVLCPAPRSNQDIVGRLEGEGISARTYFAPACHQQPLFSLAPHANLAVTEDLARRIVSLPLWEGMPEGTVARVVEALAR